MNDPVRFTVPLSCRGIGELNLKSRLNTARRFVGVFAPFAAPKKGCDKDSDWTDSVRNRLLKMRPDDCDQYPPEANRKKEFMVDFLWEEKKLGKRALLACESEWGSDPYGRRNKVKVTYDFDKLLVFKAPFKLLLFESADADASGNPKKGAFTIGDVKDMLEESLRNYWHHVPGETYVFVDFPSTGKPGTNGRYDAYVWISQQLGKQAASVERLMTGELARGASTSKDGTAGMAQP